MSRSAIYTANTGSQAVAVGEAINLGGIVRRFGCAVDLNGGTINLTEQGYYDVDISITAEPTAAGSITATLYNGGIAVPGATASATAAAAGDPVNLSIDAMVRVPCCGNSGSLSVVLSGGAATVTNIVAVVEKL